ncbi:MAG: triose-phosphate isomerase [Candidatus Paceibacterota bacterium]
MPTKKRELLVVGNWKMNPPTIGNARKLFHDIQDRLGTRPTAVRVVVAPPFPYIAPLAALSPSGRVTLGAQDVFYESGGAFTGEVSVSMLKSVGTRFIILGHSERRALGESDAEIYKDVLQVVGNKMSAIVCVGESSRDKQGGYFNTVEAQLTAALKGLDPAAFSYVTIAYEPVWAVGSGKTPAPADVYEMKLFIQKVLTDLFGRTPAAKVRVLYGGSVTKYNATELLAEGQVDGFLVGGASLRATEFAGIIACAREHTRK